MYAAAIIHSSSARLRILIMTLKKGFPLCSFVFTEQVGGNAEVFRALGEKWRGLNESDKDSYRRKAAESTSLTGVSSLSQDERAKRIIKNMMKEVARPFA